MSEIPDRKALDMVKTDMNFGEYNRLLADISALLRVARAAKNRYRKGLYFDEIAKANREIEEALKALPEGLLEE